MTVEIMTHSAMPAQPVRQQTSNERLQRASNDCASFSSALRFALEHGTGTPNELAMLAFKAGHYGRIVLASIETGGAK